jgi:Retron-type reverse transcriptase
VTWQAYGESLEEKLKELHERVHRGSYRARPAKRTYIPKADGSKRPLSIPCLEDKIVQQAVVYVLEAIYEEIFSASRMDTDRGAASTMRWTLSMPGFIGSK